MLLFIVDGGQTWKAGFVSIHHMLLFILSRCSQQECNTSFNTSHVTLYHMDTAGMESDLLSFNTSHVTLYHQRWMFLSRRRYVFQYITCYSLSVRLRPYNTSFLLFQYITCYSLSTGKFPSSISISVFQYITCYSLSKHTMLPIKQLCCFNTSHVTLYPSFYRDFIHPHV